MSFLDTLNNFIPLALKPDRPAVQYMLSYDDVIHEESSQHLKQQKDKEQLVQIDKLSQIIRTKERQMVEQETEQLQRHFMLEIEINRLRSILCEWDSQRRKYQDGIRKKQEIYQAKLQEIKIQLANQFTQKIDEIRSENKRDLERIKQVYDIRIAKLHEDTFKQEHRVKLLQMEADSKNGRLQISQGERQKLQANLLLKEDRINEMESLISQLQGEKRRLKDENDRLCESQGRELQYLRTENESKLAQNQQMKNLITELRTTIEQLRIDKQQYNDSKRRMGDKITTLEIKCETLQKEVIQFRSSRKTQHNGFIREASNNTLTHNQSERQQLSASKDNRSLARLKRPFGGDGTERVFIEEEEEHEQPERIQRIAQMEEQLTKKDEECRELISQQQELKKDIDEREKELAKLKLSVNELQVKLNQKDMQIQKIQADFQRTVEQLAYEQRSNDGGKIEKVWLERLQKSEQALQSLSQQWVKRQRELAGLFKKIDTTYKQQLQKSKEIEQSLKKENQEINQLLMQKIKQLGSK